MPTLTLVDYATQLRNKSGAGASGMIFVSTYKFAPQTPAQTLSVGSNVITLNPFPAGITSALSPNKHYLYITDGTHGNEAVLITATNGTSTVTVTCGLIHTNGQWTIKSASDGLQEAYNLIGTIGAGSIFLDPGMLFTIHGKVTIPDNSGTYSLTGFSQAFTAITRASDYPNGHMIYCAGTTIGSFQFSGFGAYGDPAGATSSGAILGINYANLIITDCTFTGGFEQIHLYGCSLLAWGNLVNAIDPRTNACVILDTDGAHACGNCQWIGGRLFGGAANYGFKLLAIDTFEIVGTQGGGSKCFVGGVPPNTVNNFVENITLLNLEIDMTTAGSNSAIRIDTAGNLVPAVTKIWIEGCKIFCESDTVYGIDLGKTVPGGVFSEIAIRNCHIELATSHGIAIGTSTGDPQITIQGTICLLNGGDGINSNACPNLTISDCQTNNNTGYGVQFTGGAQFSWIGGQSINNSAGSGHMGTTPTAGMVLANINGITDVPGVVACAATIALPLNPVVFVNGTPANISTINGGWAGRVVKLVGFTSSTLALVTGGNIALNKNIADQDNGDIALFDIGFGPKWY